MKKSILPKFIPQILFLGILVFQIVPKKSNKIEGYGGFKFGMTLEEGILVRNDDHVNDNPAYWAAYKTIERETSIYGYDALIVAQINSQSRRLDRVVIEFKKWDGGCEQLVEDIVDNLFNFYGEEFVKGEDAKGTWTFPDGGIITLYNICYGDIGQVNVAYSSSEKL